VIAAGRRGRKLDGTVCPHRELPQRKLASRETQLGPHCRAANGSVIVGGVLRASHPSPSDRPTVAAKGP